MGKARTILYEPVDKFAGVAWGFIRLVCMEHTEERPELLLRNTHVGPCYQCEKESCSASMPAELYEKLLDDVMRILNGKKNIIGHTWNRQLLRHITPGTGSFCGIFIPSRFLNTTTKQERS